MSIYEQAKLLAEEIANSEEMKRVRETELKIMIDLEAREIIDAYQEIQAEAMNSGINFEDLPDEKRKQIEDLESAMNENEIIRDYIGASQELNQILESVNMIISSALNGNSGGGCSSCSSANSCETGACDCGSGGCGN